MRSFFRNIFSILICILLINSVNDLQAYALGDVDWVLIEDNELGKQWIDQGSLERLNDNEIKVLTKFFERSTKNKDKGSTDLYVMRINCENKNFKDISINGLPNINAKWKSSNNDELIDSVIDRSCSLIIN